MKITSETYTRSQSSREAYAAAVDQIIDLDRRIFSHDSASKSSMDKLFRDARDDDNMAVLIKADGAPIGYGFVKIIHLEHEGRHVRAFQPLAGLLPQHVGANVAMMVGIKTCFRILRLCGSPTYMVAFVINPGLYRGLARILDNLYPAPRYEARAGCIEPDVLRAAIERWQIAPAEGYEQAEHFVTQDVAVKSRRTFEPRCPEDELFLAANPDYATGKYLGVCTKMTWTGMLRAAFREVTQKRSRVGRDAPVLAPGRPAR